MATPRWCWNSLVLGALVLPKGLQAQEKAPAPCELDEEYRPGRPSLMTGLIKLLQYSNDGTAALSYTARIAGDAILLESTGRFEGNASAGRAPATSATAEPESIPRVLVRAGKVWNYGLDGLMIADAQERKDALAGTWNLRDLGYNAALNGQTLGASLDQAPRWRIMERPSGVDACLCVAAIADGPWRHELTLDRCRDQAPVRAALFRDGELVCESRSTLEKQDGHWYPKKVEFYDFDYRAGKVPVNVIEIKHAEFNRPEHPHTLTPNEMGLEVGTNVHWVSEAGERTLRFWDGAGLVSQEDFFSRLRAGKLKYSARATEYSAARMPDQKQLLDALHPHAPSFETEWRKYTRGFIDRFKLTEEQAQAANRILEDCEAQARRYMASRQAELDKLVERWDDARAAASAPADLASRLIGAWRDLIAPIERIFEEQLKPRLDRLPTPAQRAKIESQPAPYPK